MPMFNNFANQSLAMEAKAARSMVGSFSLKADSQITLSENFEQDGKPRIVSSKLAYVASREGYASKPFAFVDGIAVIPVTGALIHRLGCISSYWSGYDAIVSLFDTANADPDVKGILLVVNSPGGTVAGCFDACDHIYENKGAKPVWAIYDDMACSGAMCIASAADRRLTTQTAICGSIGVVQIHASYEGMLSENGMEVTLIYSGEHKVDGNPYKNLPEDVYNSFKSQCDDLRTQFAEKVSRNLGIDLQSVIDTEAQCFTGQAAIDAGLADELINSHNIISHFHQHLSGTGSSTERSVTMSEQTTQVAAESASAGNEAEATQPQAAAEQAAPQVNEKQRIAGILQSPEAKGRTGLAEHFAFNTDMDVEAAVAALKAAPEASAPTSSNETALDAAMNATEQPNISAMGEDSEPSEAAAMVSAYKASTGAK